MNIQIFGRLICTSFIGWDSHRTRPSFVTLIQLDVHMAGLVIMMVLQYLCMVVNALEAKIDIRKRTLALSPVPRGMGRLGGGGGWR